MFALARALFFGALALMALIPAAILLAVVGLPVIAVLGLLALPAILVFFLIGLPFLILFAGVVALFAVTFGVLMAFLSVGVVALKFAFVILVPLLILGWLMRRMFDATSGQRARI
jgi:hypothetical protein